jgi:hypothetical protein
MPSNVSPRPRSFGERLRNLTTVTFGAVALLDAFVFLFVVPLIVAPSVSLVLARFNDTPVLCAVSKVEKLTGLTNCSEWTSCRIGCTAPPLKCTRVSVHYKVAKTQEERSLAEDKKILNEGQLRGWKWDQYDAMLFVNNEGCGYVPTVS